MDLNPWSLCFHHISAINILTFKIVFDPSSHTFGTFTWRWVSRFCVGVCKHHILISKTRINPYPVFEKLDFATWRTPKTKQDTVVCLRLITLLLSNVSAESITVPATKASYSWSDAMQSWHLIVLKQQWGHFYSHLSPISKWQHRRDMLKFDTVITNLNTNEQETQVCANAATESAY